MLGNGESNSVIQCPKEPLCFINRITKKTKYIYFIFLILQVHKIMLIICFMSTDNGRVARKSSYRDLDLVEGY